MTGKCPHCGQRMPARLTAGEKAREKARALLDKNEGGLSVRARNVLTNMLRPSAAWRDGESYSDWGRRRAEELRRVWSPAEVAREVDREGLLREPNCGRVTTEEIALWLEAAGEKLVPYRLVTSGSVPPKPSGVVVKSQPVEWTAEHKLAWERKANAAKSGPTARAR